MKKWKNVSFKIEERMEVVDRVWQKVKKDFEKFILETLLDNKILEDISALTLEEDYSPSERWKITTKIIKTYSEMGETIEDEKIISLTCQLYLSKHNIILKPSFFLTVDIENKQFRYDKENVILALKMQSQKESKMAINELGSDFLEKMKIYDKKKERMLQKITGDVKPALQYLGWSEDEINLTVHQALTSDSFKEGMSSQEILNMTIRTRNQMNRKN